MEGLIELLGGTEFWIGLSVIAAALPGPQTRILPALFKSIADFVAGLNRNWG